MSSFQGFSVGIGLTYPLCGFIIEHWGWRPVFYTTGSIGMLWCLMWYLLAFNSPDEHPRISCNEYNYIERNIDHSIRDGHGMRVPWKSIFQSLPAWSIGITTFGRIWVHYTFIMSGPMYMKNMLGFSIQANGVLSGTPFLCSYLSSVVFCYIADLLVKHDWMSLTNVRKVFTAMSQIIPGLLALFIGYNTNITIILIIWFSAVTLITASYAGAMASESSFFKAIIILLDWIRFLFISFVLFISSLDIVDIAPNLAGPVLAFAQTIHMSASFVNPIINGLIVTDMTSASQWQYVFITTSIIACVTYIMYQVYGTADVQPWNYPPQKLLPTSEQNGKPVIRPTATVGSTNGAANGVAQITRKHSQYNESI